MAQSGEDKGHWDLINVYKYLLGGKYREHSQTLSTVPSDSTRAKTEAHKIP